jgi:hypothetical protein
MSRDLRVQLNDLDNDSSVSRAQYYDWHTKHSNHPCHASCTTMLQKSSDIHCVPDSRTALNGAKDCRRAF